MAQGRPEEALAAFEEGLLVACRLAAADPQNAGWQRDMSVSLMQLAHFDEARRSYASARSLAEESLTIAERLASLDPTNAVGQNDVRASRALVHRLRSG
jgi:Flp pilus assembly protein TadD